MLMRRPTATKTRVYAE